MAKKDFIKISIQDIEIAEKFFENDKHLSEWIINVVRYYRGKKIQIKTKIVGKYFETYKKTMDFVIEAKLSGKLGGNIRAENQLVKDETLQGSVVGVGVDTLQAKKKEERVKSKEEIIITKESESWFLEYLNKTLSRSFRTYNKIKLRERLKSFKSEEIKQAILSASKSSYHIDESFRYLTPEYFTRNDQIIDKWVNAPKPKTEQGQKTFIQDMDNSK